MGNQPLFEEELRKLIEPARDALAQLGRLSDADARQVHQARESALRAEASLAFARAMFDILAASRLPEMDYHPDLRDFQKGRKRDIPDLHRRAEEVLADIPPFHFPVAFPEVFLRDRAGFDVILGNPPWEEVKVEEDEFWCRFQPGFKSLALKQRTRAKAELRSQRPDLLQALEAESTRATRLRDILVRGPFPGMGIGDPDLYKAFCWRFWTLVCSAGGSVGVVLPRSAFSVKGSKPFREAVFVSGSVALTFLTNNRHWVFPEVHPQYTVALTCIIKQLAEDSRLLLSGPYRSLERFLQAGQEAPATFASASALTWTDTAAIPLLPSEESAVVFSVLRQAARLDEDIPAGWRARGLSEEIHSRKEQHLMRRGARRKDDWPVYKGESFDLWTPDTGVYYGWADPKSTSEYLQSKRWNGSRRSNSPFFEFRALPGFLSDARTLPCMSARIAIRRVTNRTNQRTVLASLIPAHVFLADQASCLLWPRGDQKDVVYILGVLSSLPLDWYARRFVETDVRMHVINPLPIPRPGRDNPLWQRVVQLSGRLACPDARFSEWASAVGVECGPVPEPEKEAMIFELDAVVAHLYGLTEDHVRHIFETFHEGWDYQGRLDAVLGHYQRWASAER